MNIPEEAAEAAVRALFDDGCGEPKTDAVTALEAAAPFIAAQALREYGADLILRFTEEQELSVREVNDDACEHANEMEGK